MDELEPDLHLDFDFIAFHMWIDEDGMWTENPKPHHVTEVHIPAEREPCPDCQTGEIYIKGFGSESVSLACARCKGEGHLLTPDKELGDPNIIEAYYRQLEIADFVYRGEIEEEKFKFD